MSQLDQASDEIDAIPVKNESATEKRALSRIERRLDDEDLKHPGVQKMILDRMDVAEEKNESLEKFRTDYYEVMQNLAVAKSSLKRMESLDTAQSTMLGVGCLVLGYVPTAWGNWPLTIIATVAGLGLVSGSFLSKRSNQ
ncbi:hypothetical protein [Pseudomonas sp. BC115LW]|uniref:hypothetical protein n=1 Tax=Pseudomonas sp. BC115LW TaxID=2683267 RepID=UPI0014124FBD|nr:hypothetical protein [Pseudomonas sp. BC115LW]NBB33096.1 hypothetical protein [Pseudomonas sp. BC115LW]